MGLKAEHVFKLDAHPQYTYSRNPVRKGDFTSVMRENLFKFIHQHTLCTVLIAALLITNTASLVSFFQYRAVSPKDVPLVGTYLYTYGPNATYLAFTREQTFYIWRQHDPIDHGTYEQNGQYVTLTSDDTVFQLLIKGEHIYVFDGDSNMITQYEKFENHPVFINVTFE